jgi:release factor glutamine methyltransferase
VVEQGKEFEVTLYSAKRVSAELVGTSKENDLAILKIKGSRYPAVTFGNSDEVKVGDVAIVVGNPNGAHGAWTTTQGIISSVDRQSTVNNKAYKMFQTDAAVNPGNSGGPLCNDQGEVIGVVTQIMLEQDGTRSEGFGMAIPGNKAKAVLEDILARLRRGEPLQYIEGRAPSCGMNMVVRPGVLIPRPETAELVDWVVDDYASQRPGVLDMGTGSGCIAIALSKRLQQARVAACDISTEALAVAKENSELNGAAVELFRHDMLDLAKPLPRVYDVLVSNPPYILQSEAEEMERTVTEWEPHMALFVPDDDALRFYRAIAEWGMTEALKPGGSIYVEINQALGKETVALFENYGYKEVTLRKDIYGNDRMVKGVKSEE